MVMLGCGCCCSSLLPVWVAVLGACMFGVVYVSWWCGFCGFVGWGFAFCFDFTFESALFFSFVGLFRSFGCCLRDVPLVWWLLFCWWVVVDVYVLHAGVGLCTRCGYSLVRVYAECL